MRIGSRTIVAVSCLSCGVLIQGPAVERRRRNRTDRCAYVDRRCGKCRRKNLEERRRG